MRQLMDKADGIGNQDFQRVGNLQLANCGVQRIEKPVFRLDTGVRQRV